MEQTIYEPLTLDIERVGASYLLSLTFKNSESMLIEASFIIGNIFINDKIKMGFDAPETFETYSDCKVEKVDIDTDTENRMYLDIYVKID